MRLGFLVVTLKLGVIFASKSPRDFFLDSTTFGRPGFQVVYLDLTLLKVGASLEIETFSEVFKGSWGDIHEARCEKGRQLWLSGATHCFI